MGNRTKWWQPVLTDDEWLARIREDYPENAAESDDWLRDNYADGQKYAVTWDHLGDAYANWEELADAYLELRSAARDLLKYIDDHGWGLIPEGATADRLRDLTSL